MSQTIKELELNNRHFTIIGTAHVSSESIKEVEDAIKEKKPDCVAVELDEKRADSIKNPERYKELDLVKVLKNHQGFLMLANLVLSSMQRRMGQNVGVKPGQEMLAAISVAESLNIPVELADRPIQLTLKRAWAKSSFMGKMKLLSTLIASAFSKEETSEEEIENLKNSSEMDSMMKELSDYLPVIKKVLIDERNEYLANKIWNAKGNNVVAVIGAGHLNGVLECLQLFSEGKKDNDVSILCEVPSKKSSAKILGWIIPVIIIGLIVLAFVYGGLKGGSQILSKWFLWNAIPAGIMTLISFGHPLTVLVSFVTAPFTSLCPFIGVGFVAALVQAVVCKPKVKDMETLQEDVSSLKGWYRNRILRVFLIFIMSSLGSSFGTFAAGTDIIKRLWEIITVVE